MPAFHPRTVLQRIRARPGLRRALSQTLLGSLVLQASLMASGVAVARTLGPVDRGHFALLTLVASLVTQIGAMGIPQALTYSVSRMPPLSVAVLRTMVRPIGAHLLAASLACAALLMAMTLDRPSYVQAGAIMTVGVIAPVIAQRCGLGVLQGLKRFRQLNLMRIAPNVLFAAAVSAVVLSGRGSFLAIALAWVSAQLLLVPVTLTAAWRAARAAGTGSTQPPGAAWLLRFGRRSVFGAAPAVETYRVDQAVVAFFLAPAALGYYVVALAFTNLPRIVSQGVSIVASPLIAGYVSHGQARRGMWRLFWLAAPVYSSLAAALWAFAPDLTRIFFGEEFLRSAPVTRVLLLATVLFCARRVLTEGARAAGYPGLASAAEVVALVAVAPLFALLVPDQGIMGVAYALVASSALALAVLIVSLLIAPRRRGIPRAWIETDQTKLAAAVEEPPIDATPG